MLASRARGRIRLGPPTAAADAAAREVIDAFYAAVGRGDLAGLLAVLAPEAELRMQGSEWTLVVRGAGEVAARATMGARPDALGHPALIDGAPGVLITAGGRPVMIVAFTVADGAITRSARSPGPDRLAAESPSAGR
jgi:RNA polymerase sigma-70 factor (ECF subfamily)